jgi:DNA-binding transcriptional LysR family regulator
VIVEVEIAASAEILWRLLAGRLPLAIVGSPTTDDRVALTPFAEDELVGVARPGLIRVTGGAVDRKQLREQLLLTREPGSGSQAHADRALARAGVATAGRWELGSSEAIKRAAREGLGVAFLSRYAVAEEVRRGELESFRLRGVPPIERTLAVASLAGRELSPAERRFVETLQRCCAGSTSLAAAELSAPPRG